MGIGVVGVVLFCGLLGYGLLPWRGNIWDFDPDGVAEREAAMWRHYYDKRPLRLAGELYTLLRSQYHLSPWDSLLLAWDLKVAATTFKDSRSRREAEEAIPILERAYGRLARKTGEGFDPRRAATLELEWWQQRRERVPPEVYARTIAALGREIYSCGEDPRIEAAALERVRAMEFRDAHRRTGMTDAGWKVVQEGLRHSYRLSHAVVREQKNSRPTRTLGTKSNSTDPEH